MTTFHAIVSLLARILISIIFIFGGIEKIMGYDGAVGYMQSAGVPGSLLPLVIFAELGGGLAILFGVLSRWAGLGLAIFCLASGALFHNNFADQTQLIMFMKNVSMAGGLLLLFANGPGKYAVMD